MDKLKVASEIEYDLDMGVYDNFETLKTKLKHIASKLRESHLVINSSKELSSGEIRTLVNNDYLEKNYDQGGRQSHDFFYSEFY